MLNRVVLAVIVAVAVTLICIVIGSVLIALNVEIAVAIGSFLKTYSAAIGILAGLWHFFGSGGFNFGRP